MKKVWQGRLWAYDVQIKVKAGMGKFTLGKKVYVVLDKKSVTWL
jgi:hypothetical protein